MFSIGDTVFVKSLDKEGIVERINGDFITVRFKDFPAIGIHREDLTIISKTTNQRELNKTLERNRESTKFSFDGDLEKIFSEASISLTKFVEKLNYYRNKWTRELSYYWVLNLLIKNGYLEVDETGTKVPTTKGKLYGITRKKFYRNKNDFGFANFYDLCAQ